MMMLPAGDKREDKNPIRVMGKVKDVVLGRRGEGTMTAMVVAEENKNSKIFSQAF